MSEQTNITIPANSNILEVLLSLGISYQALKERLFLRLSNKSILDSHENLYFRPYAKDMIISYHLLLSEGSGRVRSMPMTNALIEQFEIDTDDLHKLALANTERIWLCQIDTLTDTLQALGAKMERSDHSVLSPMDDMFTLSNISRTFGSSVILYPGVLAKASAKVGRSDLYLIPESVEGWLFGTVDNLVGHGHDYAEAYEYLKKTIKEVKDTTFSNKEDILSSEPLYYDALNKKLLKFSDMVAVSKVINDMAI